jgi:hypothetical protein
MLRSAYLWAASLLVLCLLPAALSASCAAGDVSIQQVNDFSQSELAGDSRGICRFERRIACVALSMHCTKDISTLLPSGAIYHSKVLLWQLDYKLY